MPHGLPDYGINVAKEINFNLADLADLAVRMGSIVEYDRRGDVIYLDDYESPLRRYREIVSANCSARLDSTSSRSGAQCCKLATSGVINDFAATYYYLAPMVSGRHGAKISVVHLNFHTSNSEYVIYWSVFTGTHNINAGIALNPWARTIAYYDPAGVPVVFEDNFRPISSNVWQYHNMKLVVDFDTGYYVRFLFDILEWDMSALRFLKNPNPGAPQHTVALQIEALAAAVKVAYQDDFVYTLNEP